VNPLDVATIVGAGFLLLALVVAVSAVPAWRVSRVDPLRALQVE
jgi:ABC-type antimicrobial peptide transport system permease subunit